ncbi:hypothetical protein AVEN_175682-1 [Araneus ventricosus]|uniref:Uncharacterized protein n=1 Tax=Araneus ventricosus TaxID=182803 RepID=A0A4Y2F185_ARAVE|nr:hypothetical protein AVEN_175682-1 [Araneus ventricosus]
MLASCMEKLNLPPHGKVRDENSSARPSTRVHSPTENHEPAQDFQYYRRTIHGKGGECSFCWHETLDARGKKSDFVHCLYALAGYNGMTFTPWVTLPGEKTPDVHRPFHPGPG